MMSDDIDRIKRIKQMHERQWLAIDGVVAVGVGATSSGRVGLIVSVKEGAEKIRTQIPTMIDDIDVEIKETGEIRAL